MRLHKNYIWKGGGDNGRWAHTQECLYSTRIYQTVSTVDLTILGTSIRLQKSDKTQELDPDLYVAYTHPSTASTKGSWDFLEEIEDQLGDTIVMCGDFNARSSVWDQQGNNPQGNALPWVTSCSTQ